MEYSGVHEKGSGAAHRYDDRYVSVFNRPMCGTFNVKMGKEFPGIGSFTPAINWLCEQASPPQNVRLWLCKITSGDGAHERRCWIVRGERSKRSGNDIEIVSRSPLPPAFGGRVSVEVMEPWDEGKRKIAIKEWYTKSFCHTFSWSPRKCDSDLIWQTVRDHATWRGARVFDIGCLFGYHSIAAAKAGAEVVGFDTNPRAISIARAIADRIEMMDVNYITNPVDGPFDVIFYFSVHHQIDPFYERLEERMAELRVMAKHAFVELILPPMFGGSRTEADVDQAVGGEILHTYTHSVRGVRRIYHLEQ